jgi:dihydroxyacetone kinase-like predicted kinase
MDGVEIKKDDYVGFVEDKIYIDDQNRKAVAFGLTEKLGAKRYDIMLVIVGEDVPKAEADEIYKELKKAYRRTEIVMIDGGQPIYDYIIILE